MGEQVGGWAEETVKGCDAVRPRGLAWPLQGAGLKLYSFLPSPAHCLQRKSVTSQAETSSLGCSAACIMKVGLPSPPIFPAGLRRGWPGWKKFCTFKNLNKELTRKNMTIPNRCPARGIELCSQQRRNWLGNADTPLYLTEDVPFCTAASAYPHQWAKGSG